MTQYNLTIGLNDKNTKTQLIKTPQAIKIIKNTLLDYTDGYTILSATGGYKHHDNTKITEKSIRVELLFTSDDAVKSIVKQLKQLLNQESIAVAIQEINSYLW